jgi:hypothetical protein
MERYTASLSLSLRHCVTTASAHPEAVIAKDGVPPRESVWADAATMPPRATSAADL